MRAPLSVVIPTLNAGSDTAATVASLYEGLENGMLRDLVISDGGSDDGIQTLAEDLGARFVTGPASRGGQLIRGADIADGVWYLFLHADTVLEPGWTTAVGEHFSKHPDKAGYFRLAFRADGFSPWIVALWANARSHLFGLPYGDQGLLISRTLYRDCGGFPDSPLMEDVAIARKLKGKLRQLNATARTGAEKYQAEGWFWRGAKNMWTLARYFLGESPETLSEQYRK